MLAWTVEAALASGVFDRVVVTTDSEDIARVAREAGAEVPFLRDATLADDHTPVSAATADALRRAGNRQVRVVAQGSGFSISSDGQALTVGVIGQAARVRMDNGRILTGTVLDARTVELAM